MNKPLHILRFGTIGDRKHLEKQKDTFDCLAINANSVAYVSASISKFIIENISNDNTKGYFIDPITYAFQNNLNLIKNGKNEIKKSMQKLIESYGEPLLSKIPKGIITHSDFANEDIKIFCEQVLKFQSDTVKNYAKDNEIYEYLKFEVDDEKEIDRKLSPEFLIAPYFYLNSEDNTFEEWLSLNIELVKASLELSKDKQDVKIFAQIVLSQDSLLNEIACNKIAEAYSKLACHGYTIWIDNLNEHEFGQTALLESFVNFLDKLKKSNNERPIYNMYGGFFSILLTHKTIALLNGVSHGLEYGESRAVYPVGGGIPVSKYYFLPLHQRLDFTRAFEILKERNYLDTSKTDWGDSKKYFDEICDCIQCKETIKNQMLNFYEFESNDFYEIKRKEIITRRKKATKETREICLYHFLHAKYKEFDYVINMKLPEIITMLKKSNNNFSSNIEKNLNDFLYIENWIKICEHFLNDD